jgi:TorA maturation chaperone TorD
MAEKTVTEESLDELVAASAAYQLLARLWLREVDIAMLRLISQSALAECFTLDTVPSGRDSDLIDHLAGDYCQLFIGPAGHLPPFQSVWEAGQFQSSAAASMSQFIDVTGYDDSSQGTMADHLGVQLGVMGLISRQCADRQSNLEELSQLMELKRAYFMRHLTWTEELLQQAIRKAESEFYESVLLTTGWALECEHESHSINRTSIIGGCD